MAVNLKLASPVQPMLAKLADKLPEGDGWIFEPKWDGFRVILFRDGDDWLLQSRDRKSLNRYFPEMREPILTGLPEHCVLDGEVVIATDAGLDFDALSLRIHPAASRVAMLAEKQPASLVFWDVLCLDDEVLLDTPFGQRRALLEQALADVQAPLHVTPMTRDVAVAADWFKRFEGAGFDGVMAKRDSDAYQPKKRAMLKIKHKRTADCVIAGYRWHKDGPGTMIGSLLLGLYDAEGVLHHVGVATSFTAKRRHELVAELEPLRAGADEANPWVGADPASGTVRVPGAKSRWSKGKNLQWVPLRPERTCEVTYGHMEGMRFRHTAHFARWRPDKPAAECTFAQLDVAAPYELNEIFGK